MIINFRLFGVCAKAPTSHQMASRPWNLLGNGATFYFLNRDWVWPIIMFNCYDHKEIFHNSAKG